jgi:hypothetical protein
MFAPSVSMGYGFHDSQGYGDAVDAVSIRSAAMGGARVFGSRGAEAIFLNPASLDAIGKLNLSASGTILEWTEEVVDSIDTESITRSDNGLGGLTGAAAFRLNPEMVISLGCARVSDFQYKGTHFLPENPSHPGVDIIETLVSKGGLWEALGGASWRLSDLVTTGVSAGLRFGTVSYEYSLDNKFTSGIDSTSSWSWDLSDFCYHGGITLGDELFSAGVCYTSGSPDRYYSRLAIAGRATAEHLGNTTVGFEGEIRSPFDENLFDGKLSIVAPIRDRVDLMAGVGFRDAVSMHRVGTIFSVGGSYTADRLRLDFAIYTNSRSRRSTSFPNEYSSHVDDSWTNFCLGLQYMI